MEEEKCHSCNALAEGQCERCEQDVCVDCTFSSQRSISYMNQIDYTLCLDCNDIYEIERCEENKREQAQNVRMNKLIERYGSIEKGMNAYFKQKKMVNYIIDKTKNP